MKNKLNNAIITIIFCLLMLTIKYTNFVLFHIKYFNAYEFLVQLSFMVYIVHSKKLKRVNIEKAGVAFIISFIVVLIVSFLTPTSIIEKNIVLMYFRENFDSFIYIIISATAIYLYFKDKKLINKKDLYNY